MSKANDFTVIPALDLMDGNVVHAKAGPRAEYRPLASPFGQAGDPGAIARGLLAATGSSVLYIADLDAITGSGSNFDLVRGLVNDLGLSAIIVTHDLAVARLLSHRMMVMKDGFVIEQGLTDRVLDDPREPYTQLLVSSILQV